MSDIQSVFTLKTAWCWYEWIMQMGLYSGSEWSRILEHSSGMFSSYVNNLKFIIFDVMNLWSSSKSL